VGNARSALVCPPQIAFLNMPFSPILGLNIFQLGEKLLLRKETLFNKQLRSGIDLDGICDLKFFEAE
jgi:hypothetical protein